VNDCILWTGATSNRGYGLTYRDGRRVSAHREAFLKANGYLPALVMHKCDTPLCVNPDHLVAGNQSENMKDCAAKGRLKLPSKDTLRRGDTHPRTKLTAERLSEMMPLVGTMSMRALARRFQVDESTIRKHPALAGR